MIAAAKASQLVHAAFGFAFTAPGNFPVVIYRNAMPFGMAAIERSAVFFHVILGATTHKIVELALGNLAESMALAAGAH